MKVKVTQSCPTLQAKILEGVAFPFSRDLPNPEIEPGSPTLQADALTSVKLQYFSHLMQRAHSLEKSLMLERLRAGGEGNDIG